MKRSAGSLDAMNRPLLEAVAFAARAHGGQWRKDKVTPYVSHVFRACLIVRDVFGVADHAVLTAAVLHDTIEDTKTDFDDMAGQFGPRVARWVALLSKDKRLPDREREAVYMRKLSRAPWQVQVCKLADIFDNITDSVHTGPSQQAKTMSRSRAYLAALKKGLRAQARRPFRIVARLLAEREARLGQT